jgi:hypothetical protein
MGNNICDIRFAKGMGLKGLYLALGVDGYNSVAMYIASIPSIKPPNTFKAG